jgi:drug/metabolite transporter (DMT)-like permease
MIWLILSILLNTYIGIAFKVFERFGISTLQAITFNYWICGITGLVFLGDVPAISEIASKPYLSWALFNGAFFFIVFVAIGLCTVRLGINATQTSNKLSLVIPVAIALSFYGEAFSILKLLGILLALGAVILSSSKDEGVQAQFSFKQFLLPAFIFIGSGLLDTLSNYLSRTYLSADRDANLYLICTFFSAAICSTFWLAYKFIQKQEQFGSKNILGAIALGIPNYFSIYTLIAALKSGVLQSSSLFPVNNISVVVLSTVVAVIAFGEKLNTKNKLGVGLAVIAIITLLLAK